MTPRMCERRVLAEYFDDAGIQDLIGTVVAAVTELSATSAIKTVALAA